MKAIGGGVGAAESCAGRGHQFDWNHETILMDGTPRTARVATIRRCHGRMLFVPPHPREGREMVFDAHDKASAFLGDACQRGIRDDVTTAVDAIFGDHERGDVIARARGEPLRRLEKGGPALIDLGPHVPVDIEARRDLPDLAREVAACRQETPRSVQSRSTWVRVQLDWA